MDLAFCIFVIVMGIVISIWYYSKPRTTKKTYKDDWE